MLLCWFHLPNYYSKLPIINCVVLVLCYIFIFHFMFKFTTLFIFHSSGSFCLHYSSTMRSHGSAIWIFIHDPWEALITLARLTGNAKRIFTPAREGTTIFWLLWFKNKVNPTLHIGFLMHKLCVCFTSWRLYLLSILYSLLCLIWFLGT